MKKIFLLLSIFVLSKVGYSQFPVIQYIGSDSTIVKSRGGLQGRFAPIPFTDTTSANLSRISQYPGALIYTSGVDKYWYRNATTTGWIEFTSSGGSTVNIYNSNGTISEDRYVDGGEHRLQFNALQSFQVAADSITFNLVENYLFLTGLVSTQDTSTYKPMVVDPITGRVLQSSYWYGGTGGSGGSGIVSLGTSAYGLITQNDSTYKADTIQLSTRLWRQKGIDSVQANIDALPQTLQEVLATQGNDAVLTSNTDVSPDSDLLTLQLGGNEFWKDIESYTRGHFSIVSSNTGLNSTELNIGADSIYIFPHKGQINIDSLRSWAGTTISDTTYKKVMTWDTRNGRVEYSNWLGSGGGGGGVTTIASINGTTKSSNGAVISGANFYMQTVDGTYPGLMTSAQKARLDSNSYLTIDKRYDSLAWRRNDSTFLIKSLRVQAYGTTQTPTLTDSSFSVNITKAPPTKQSVTSTSDTLHLVNDSTTLTNTKVYGYASGTRGWKDALEMTLTNPSNGDAIIYSSGALVNGRKVDSIYRTAGKDSIIYLISGTRYAIKDSTGGGGGSASGNYGNVQLNRNGTFATPASDSLNFTAGSGLNVIGKYLIGGTRVVNLPASMTGTSVFGDGGNSLSHSSGNQGYYNTLVGITAGGTMTTGYMNVGVGWSALGGATMSGWENTAVGTGAMYSATSAQQNVAIGKYALFSMTTGLNNIGIGFESLYSNTNSYNIGLGHSAGRLNSSGAENLYIGYFAGYYNQTGSFNTYVGSQAGLGVSTNSNANNVGIGYKNLYAITTGSNNISIGFQSGDALTSGSNNIIIGYNIDAASNTASNQMTIGNAIFGTGISGTGTTAAGKVGILNNAPDSTFDVTGGMKTSGGVRFTGLPNGGTSSDSLLVATSTGQVKKINAGTFAIQVENQYTPTLTNTTNIAASTAYATFYTVIGTTVHVWGTVDIDATSALSVCEMGLSLPVTSSLGDIYNLAGTAAFEDNTAVQIKADVANSRAVWRFTPQTATNNKYSFHFTYKYTAP